jgi:tetratricopeptide (TPR) repeat protein
MQQTHSPAVLAALLLALYVVLSPSLVAAEPILGEESLGPPAGGSPRNQEQNEALALFKAGDYDGALRLWKEAARNNKDLPPAEAIMAMLFQQANMPDKAKTALERAMADAPDDPEPYLIAAGMALREGDAAKAESLFQKALALLSSFSRSATRKNYLLPRVHSGLVTTAETRKDWPGAQKLCEQWLKDEPKSTVAMQRRAYCLFQQKNVDAALAELREVAKIEPKMLTPEAVLAQYYQRTGDQENAKKWMDAALAAAPKDVRTLLAAGQRAFEKGHLDEARKHALAATRLDPQSLEVKLLQASVATFEKNYMAAELFFDAALRQSPENFPISNNLALVLVEQKDETKNRRALEYAEANMKRLPGSPEAASTYGFVLFRLGRLDEAEKALRIAAPIANSDIDTAYAIASVRAERGLKSEARRVLETALKNARPAMFRQEAEELLQELKK